MKTDKLIESVLAPGNDITVDAAVSALLSEGEIKSGQQVAVIEDPTYPHSGQKGRVRTTESAKGSGFVDVEFADGSCMPYQSNLLIPL